MIINLVYTAAAQAAPVAFRNTMQSAANYLAGLFTDNITINLQVDYSGTGGGASAGPSGGLFEPYSTVRDYLNNNRAPGDTTFTSLPAGSTIGGNSTVAVWDAQLKLMGLRANDGSLDGQSTFATDIASNLLFGVALHELTHAMGRVPYGPQPDILEFYRYTSKGNYLFTGAIPAPSSYFSLNGGANRWANYGVNSDPSDFLNDSLSPGDPNNEFYNAGTIQGFTPLDIEQMIALGYHTRGLTPASDAHDFNGDNNGDILLQASNGQIVYANMAGGVNTGFGNLTQVPGWTVFGSGHISGGVDANPVIFNGSQVVYGNVVNGAVTNWVNVGNIPGFSLVGIGDINRDAHEDIVFENLATGQIVFANMANGVNSGFGGGFSVPGWTVRGVGDINYDNYADLVLQNGSGQVVYANMAGGVLNGYTFVVGAPGYNVVGVGDINRDGNADIVFQNSGNGQIVYANMHNGVFSGFVNVVATPGYSVVAVEHVAGDGYDDIVIQNAAGQLLYANMTSGVFQGFVVIGQTPGYAAHTGLGQTASGASSSDHLDLSTALQKPYA